MTTLILFLRLSLSLHPVAPAHPHHLKPDTLVLDMSGPAEPESEFPMMVAKGRL